MSGYKKTKKQYHQMKYLIDTNILIQAKNIHYRMSTFSCIWQWLQETSEVKILDAVFTEILRQDDELKDWVINLHELNPENFFSLYRYRHSILLWRSVRACYGKL